MEQGPQMLLGQAGKLRSATTPKLASWNVHEQSFFWRTSFGDQAGKINIFLRVLAVPWAKPSRTPKGYAVPLLRNPVIAQKH